MQKVFFNINPMKRTTILQTPFAEVYSFYIQKAEKKGRTKV